MKSLTELQKNEIVMLMKEKTYNKEDYLWKKGEQCNECFFVFSGSFQIVEKPENRNGILDCTYKGNLIGDFPS